MKRGYFIGILLVLLLTTINASTSQETGVSVSVVSNNSYLDLISPQNTTYQENEYILLDYNSNLIDTVWYNLDNTANTTINTSFYFQTSVGQHTLYLYGNMSNGTVLSDNITFTVQAETAPSGGGAKKEVIVEEENITISEEKIPVTIKQTETKEIRLLIKNNKETGTNIRIDDQDLTDLLIRVSDIEFYLNPGEAKEVTFTFSASKDKTPDIYLEKAILVTDGLEKEILFYIEVESLGFLFDVDLEIPKDPTVYKPGDELISQVTFYNLGKAGETDVQIEYVIKDIKGNIIFGEKQNLIIGMSLSMTKTFKLPDTIEEGDYIFYIKVTYDSNTASASKWFTVKRTPAFLSSLKGFLERNGIALAKLTAIIVGSYIFLHVISLINLKRFYPGKRRIAKKRIVKRKKKRGKRKYPKILRAVLESQHR